MQWNAYWRPNWGAKKFFLMHALACVAFFAMAGMAKSAETVWEGNHITVGPQETLVIDRGSDAREMTVDKGGTVIIQPNTSFGINGEGSSFSNAGNITSYGTFYFNNDVASVENSGVIHGININAGATNEIRVSSPEQFTELLSKGQLAAGSIVSPDGGEEAQGRTRIYVGGNTPGTVELQASNLVSGETTGQAGQIVLNSYGHLRVASLHNLIIHGDTLNIGSIGYDPSLDKPDEADSDITDSAISQVIGGNVTLLPDSTTNQVTLAKGLLRVNKGLDPSSQNPADTEHFSTLNIGTPKGSRNAQVYDGTLVIRGGALSLGGGGNTNGGGTINGNVVIGGAQPAASDSLLFARAGDWTVNGDLTLNRSGILNVEGGYSQNLGELESSLTIARDFIFEDGNYSIKAPVVVNGDMYVRAGDIPIDSPSFEVQGAIHSSGGSLSINSPLFIAPRLMGAKSTILSIGGQESAGASVRIDNVKMNGGQINFDPPFIAAGDTSNASTGGLRFESDNIDARMNIGRNSMVTVGSTNPEWLREKIAEYQTENNLLWGRDITSALALRAPQTLSSIGGINVDGTWTHGGNPATENTARFADKSLFVVDAAGTKGRTALSGNGTGSLKVESGAKLLVTDAANNEEIIITDDFASANVSPEGWSANMSTDLQNAEGVLADPETGKFVVRVKEDKAPVEVFPALDAELGAVVAVAATEGLNTDAADAGLRFISRAVDNRFIGSNDRMLAAATVESAARMTVAGAVPQMAMAANEAAGAAITQRTGFAQPDGMLQSIDENGNMLAGNEKPAKHFALWIMPLYQSTNGFGMEAGNFNYDFSGSLGGVALGADYTFGNMLRFGLSFNIGGGYAQGSGDLNKTTNNMNFWGIGAYAGWTRNNFGLTADVNYTSTYNELKQELPDEMLMRDLKGDVNAWALSTGLRAEYRLATSVLDIVPHAGFRFTNLNVDSYDIHSNGTVIDGDSYSQNIWTFPIGVSFTKKYELDNGWNIKPLLDLNVTPAAGDFNAKSKVRFTGIGQEAELETKMMDYVTYGGTAGIEFGNDSFSIGVSYNGKFGAESSAHGVFGTFRYEF